MTSVLRVLVLSDLHAHDGDPRNADAPSHFSTDPRFATADANPMVGIVEVVRDFCGTVDWILCPGDLGDKAEASAQAAAWQKMLEIRNGLGAKLLIGATGNHDVDSRRIHPDFDPKGNLLDLVPRFPIELSHAAADDRLYSDRYWARNFVTVKPEGDDVLLVILNSSAFHGYTSDATKPPNEHLNGKISPKTISMLKEEIARQSSRINIFMLHHHLRRHPFINDNSEMKNGDKLIEMLKETDRQWLVIHGHQHVPYLSYSDAHYLAPVILSSGSVSAKTWEANKKHPRNQMHLVEIDLATLGPNEQRGQITSWTWVDFTGWKPGTEDAGLPYKGGFGSRADLRTLAKELAEFTKDKAAPVPWDDLTAFKPEAKYLIPDDLKGLCDLLGKEGIGVQYDRFGGPITFEAQHV